MIYEAKLLGASAILLICSLLTEKQIREFLSVCDELGPTRYWWKPTMRTKYRLR